MWAGLVPPGGAEGGAAPCCSPGIRWLPTALGLWRHNANLCLPSSYGILPVCVSLCLHITVPLCVCVSMRPNFPHLIRTPAIELESILTYHSLNSITSAKTRFPNAVAVTSTSSQALNTFWEGNTLSIHNTVPDLVSPSPRFFLGPPPKCMRSKPCLETASGEAQAKTKHCLNE